METLINKYKIETKELAVLTPYKDQKILIRKLLEEKRIVDISVRTITESQGMYDYNGSGSNICANYSVCS